MSDQSQSHLSLGVYGASGRMGQQVLAVAREMKPPFKKILSIRRFSEFHSRPDVIVDFSLPDAQKDLIQFCLDHMCPLVSGTTGLSAEQMQNLRTLSEKVAVLWAPNMSIGVMAMNKLLRELKVLSSWEFELRETHHTGKLDKPSGTALRLKETLEKALHRPVPKIESLRQGDVIGDHRVTARSPFEEISIEHRATDRRVFAEGALRAALWLIDQGPGFYSLEDIAIA